MYIPVKAWRHKDRSECGKFKWVTALLGGYCWMVVSRIATLYPVGIPHWGCGWLVFMFT